MTREEALELLERYMSNRNLMKHTLAVEAVMRRLARHFGEDAEHWGLAGLLHDIDYDQTAEDPARHTLVSAEILTAAGVPEDIVYAVKVHNDHHGLPRKTALDQALFAADPLTGLIVASALIHPEKKLAAIDASFVTRRFGESGFARGARRESIATCSELGLDLEEFTAMALEAMQGIAGDLGL